MDIDDVAPISGEANATLLTERARISSIIESAEGRRNPEMAQELAFRTSLSVEQAKGLLAKVPAANPYLAAMEKEGPVGIEANAQSFTTGDAKAARLAEIGESMKAFNASRGTGTKA